MRGLVSAPFLWMPTHLSFLLMQRVNELLGKKLPTTFLPGPLSTRPPFHYELGRNAGLGLICYAGHGTEKSLVGEDLLFHMFHTGDARPIIKDKIIVAIPACSSARELGPKCIEAGASCFIGATDVMYAAFNNSYHKFFSDWQSQHMALYETLFRGGTAREALEAYKERGRYYVRLYKSHPEWADSDWHAMAFNQNVEVTTLLGDPSARIGQVGGDHHRPPRHPCSGVHLSFELPDLRTLFTSFFVPLGVAIAVPLVVDAVRRAVKRD